MGRRIELRLQRTNYKLESTAGIIVVNDPAASHAIILHTLEPQWRDLEGGAPKIRGKTAIPAGNYRLTRWNSPKHKEIVPLLIDVPNFDMVEIHVGNFPRDTQGCILVGKRRCENRFSDYLTNSRAAFKEFMQWFLEVTDDPSTEVWLSVQDADDILLDSEE